jgi:hypothetical protein
MNGRPSRVGIGGSGANQTFGTTEDDLASKAHRATEPDPTFTAILRVADAANRTAAICAAVRDVDVEIVPPAVVLNEPAERILVPRRAQVPRCTATA